MMYVYFTLKASCYAGSLFLNNPFFLYYLEVQTAVIVPEVSRTSPMLILIHILDLLQYLALEKVEHRLNGK